MKLNRLNRSVSPESPEVQQLGQAFQDLADLIGLNLVVYNRQQEALADCRPSPICKAIQMDTDGCRLCERDCGGMLDQAFRSGQLVSYKCHGHLYNFAAPIKVNGVVNFAVLGGRIFRNYQDFSAFSKMAPKFQIRDYFFEDWENLLRSEGGHHFERAARFIQSMVDALYRDSVGIGKSREKVDRVGTLYDVVRSLTDSPLDKIAEVVLQAVSVLFDIPEGAIWQAQGQDSACPRVSQLGRIANSLDVIRLSEYPEFGKLTSGHSMLTRETYQILMMGLPETVKLVHSFPILLRNNLFWVVQVFNAESVDKEAVTAIESFCSYLSLVLENAVLRAEIESKQSVLSVVMDFNSAIGSELESPGLYQAILLKAAELVAAEKASLMIFDEASQDLSIKHVKGLNEKIAQSIRVKSGEGIAGLVFDTGRPLLVRNVDEDARFCERQRTRYKSKSLICVPLKIQQKKIGVINLTDKAGNSVFDESDLKLIESIASQASVALDRTGFYKMSEDLRKISITDSLTDLYNRRFFQDRIVEEIERARRHSQAISLIMLDIDNFKSYNDAYGHLAGDEALRLTAATLKSSVRHIDLVARYGGEEFAVILPMTEIEAAKDIAERIRSGVAGRYFPDNEMNHAIRLTVSLGIASFPAQADNMFDLIGNADKALYLAKLTGKNQTTTFDNTKAVRNATNRR